MCVPAYCHCKLANERSKEPSLSENDNMVERKQRKEELEAANLFTRERWAIWKVALG